ncbi:hypothetical protein PILCRDRAFT_103451 [Piloderma croceum F 1598]|uniref:J domain-containing protein n=1 Tax=Piloderma croceum (strain F 1598) TaxID=765440 RepID=A0A0C3CQG5_PILCF|nr:hypothetical protein PILCRDRAFT_103451 [Piloderma croceum F 1598]
MWAAQRQVSRPLFGRLAGVHSATTRSTSSGSNPYPYPTHTNPNPYQIFHLPHNASQAEVKRRYIDLVRIYHPDSPVSRALPPEVTDGRFQAITKAYDALRGKTPMTPEGIQSTSDAQSPTLAVWRARQARRLDLDAGGDDRWKDRVILFGVIFTIAGFIVQTMLTRREALEEMQRKASHATQNTRTRHAQRTEDWALAASESDETRKKS